MSSNILIGNKAIDEGKKKGAIDGKNSVLLNPSAYNLYTQAQMDAIGSYDTGKSKGISDVNSSPHDYNLYTKDEYESHSIPHKVRVIVRWDDSTEPNVTGTGVFPKATYTSKIYVDDKLFDSYTEKNNNQVRNIYRRDQPVIIDDVDSGKNFDNFYVGE